MQKLSPWEDCLLERKTQNDLKDLTKTFVAFANSVRPNHIATVLIGEKNDGTVQGVENPDGIQKTVREKCDGIYPPILWRSVVYEKEGKYCVRVEIEHSGNTPHFAGAAWIRKGSESIPASEEMLQKLITLRSGKNRELEKWIGKRVTASWVKEGDFQGVPKMNRVYKDVILAMLTEFHVTFETVDGISRKSEPLSALTLSWDDNENRLRIFITAV